MAPHDTNTPREVRRHRWPLIGMAACVLVVFLGFLWWVNRSTEGRDEVHATEDSPAMAAPDPGQPK